MRKSATNSGSGNVPMLGPARRGFVLRSVLALGVITLGLIFVASAGPARAHTELVASTPGPGATITELPQMFSVTTSEPLLDLAQDASGFGLQVIDSSGKYFGDGCLVVSESTLSMGPSLGAQGDYRFVWQVVAEDGHPVSGEFAFAWAPDPDAQIVAGADEPPACDNGETEPSPDAIPTADATADSTVADPVETAADSAPTPALIGVAAVIVTAAAGLIFWLKRRRP